jgi:D-erythrulose 1-phosphate 3-epimerase
MKAELKLSVNTGFAVNRFSEPEDLADFCKNYLNIKFIQPTSDWLNLNMPNKFSVSPVRKINKIFIKHNLKVNSTFTGAYTRLNHLAHPDKNHQIYWVKWFKRFIDVSEDLGAKYVGSHLGILTYKDNNTKDRNSILINRVIKNWWNIAEYASKKKIKALIWEPMSISREFGETINECKKIQKTLNKKNKINFKICLDVGHGDLNSKNKINFNPYSWLEEFAKESPVIHLKQVIKNNFSHLPFTKKNNKNGIIQASKVLNILKKKEIKDTELALELSFKERDPIDKNLKKDVLDSVSYWRKYINKSL